MKKLYDVFWLQCIYLFAEIDSILYIYILPICHLFRLVLNELFFERNEVALLRNNIVSAAMIFTKGTSLENPASLNAESFNSFTSAFFQSSMIFTIQYPVPLFSLCTKSLIAVLKDAKQLSEENGGGPFC